MVHIKNGPKAVSNEDFQAYVDGGYEAIPENKFQLDKKAFFDATMERITASEVPFSYFGHRGAWRSVHKDEVYTLYNTLRACFRELREYCLFKTGFRPQGTDVPSGCDDEGNIIKPKGPCIITASGPSLDKLMPLVKNWKGGLICSANAQASTLRYYGAHPSHVFLFDSTATVERFKKAPLNPRKTILITHPGINPQINEGWTGQKYWYKVYSPNSMVLSEIMRSAFDFLHSTHYPFACAIAGQTAFAHAMGYDPLIYVGADFSFTEDQARFNEWNCDVPTWKKIRGSIKSSAQYYSQFAALASANPSLPPSFKEKKPIRLTKKWTEKPGRSAKDESRGAILLRTKSGYLTHYIHMIYAATTVAVQWLDGPNIVDCSDGQLTGLMPKGNLEEIIETQGACLKGTSRTKAEIRDFIAPWLASRGSFYVPMLEGWKLIDVENLEVDMPIALSVMKQQDEKLDIDAIMDYCRKQIERGPSMPYGPNTIRKPAS